MEKYEIRITKTAKKDIEKLTPKLKKRLRVVLEEILSVNPLIGKKLAGDLKGSYSYRLTFKDRIVYSIDENDTTIYIERARTHYGD